MAVGRSRAVRWGTRSFAARPRPGRGGRCPETQRAFLLCRPAATSATVRALGMDSGDWGWGDWEKQPCPWGGRPRLLRAVFFHTRRRKARAVVNVTSRGSRGLRGGRAASGPSLPSLPSRGRPWRRAGLWPRPVTWAALAGAGLRPRPLGMWVALAEGVALATPHHVGGPGGSGAPATPPRGSAEWEGLRGFAFVDRLPSRVTWRGTARFTQTLSALNTCDSGAVEVRSMCSQEAEVTSGVRSGSLLNTVTFEWPSPNGPGREACAALPVLGAGSPRLSACPLGSGVVMAHGASWQGLPKSLAEILNTELNFSLFCLLTFLIPACPRLTDGSLRMREKGVQRSRQCPHCPPPRDRHTWP